MTSYYVYVDVHDGKDDRTAILPRITDDTIRVSPSQSTDVNEAPVVSGVTTTTEYVENGTESSVATYTAADPES